VRPQEEEQQRWSCVAGNAHLHFKRDVHTLALESSLKHGGNGHYDNCSCDAVQNELHVLFLCQE